MTKTTNYGAQDQNNIVRREELKQHEKQPIDATAEGRKNSSMMFVLKTYKN